MLRSALIHLSESTAAKAVVTRTPLRGMSRRFVPGETVDDLVRAARAANAEGLDVTGNYLGESEKNRETARSAADTYLRVLGRFAAEGIRGGVSVKFTQLGQEISPDFLEENLGRLLEEAREHDTFVRFDMEDSSHVQRTLEEFERFWSKGWRRIGVVLQSYLYRTMEDIRRMNALRAPVRLCKGAYAEPAEVAYQEKEEVDANFVRCMRLLLSEGEHPAIATHDERMIAATREYAHEQGIGPDRFEFQMLHGVRRDLQRELVEEGFQVRVYVPFGESWYPYLMRRLAERPANVLFLAGSVIRESPLGFLWPGGRREDGRAAT